jgi:hypothetical protein
MNLLERLSLQVLWICLAVLANAAAAQVYTWTDAQGKKHFSDDAMRPKDQATPEARLSPGNVADRFQPRGSPSDNQAKPAAEGTQGGIPPAPIMPTAPPRPLSGVDRSQNDCRTKWNAYYDGADCYAACGQTLGGFGTRNNAACGHCTDAPRPNC